MQRLRDADTGRPVGRGALDRGFDRGVNGPFRRRIGLFRRRIPGRFIGPADRQLDDLASLHSE